jgi:hypothetical protein
LDFIVVDCDGPNADAVFSSTIRVDYRRGPTSVDPLRTMQCRRGESRQDAVAARSQPGGFGAENRGQLGVPVDVNVVVERDALGAQCVAR